jgi:hypothetical protein
MHRILLLSALVVLALAGGCREEGAAERAGKKSDEALDELTHPDEGPLEKFGRKTDEALEDVQRAFEETTERE